MENNDDTRKKRDSKEVVDEGSVIVNEEKSKKLRAAATTGRNESETSTISQHDVPDEQAQLNSSEAQVQLSRSSTPPPPPSVQRDPASASIGDGSRPAAHATTATVPEVSNPAVTANTPENSANITAANGNALPVDFNVKEGSLDLEVALHRIVRMNEKSDIKEYLSTSNPSSWVTFRVGHAGDASTLAACYRKSKAITTGTQSTVQGDGGATATTTSTTVQCATKSPVNSREYDNSANNSNNQSDKRSSSSTETHPGTTIYAAPTVGIGTTAAVEDTSLEIRLAEGLGDEDTPPCIFALLAEVESFKEPDVRHLGAAALLSIAWQDGVKVLQVEWLYVCAFPTESGANVDGSHFPSNISNLLERRMWLRLSALVMMTGCQVLQAPNQSGSRCNEPPKPDKTGPPSCPDAVAVEGTAVAPAAAPTPTR